VPAADPGAGVPAALVAGGTSGSVLLILAAAAGAVVLLRRAQRRGRLTEGTADDRITGAWLEFTDALRLAGRPVPRHLAATEAASYAATVPPPRPVRELAGARVLRRAELAGAGVVRRAVPGRTLAGAGLLRRAVPGRTLAGAGLLRRAVPGRTPAAHPPEPPAGATPVDSVPLPPLDALVHGVNTTAFAPGAADVHQATRAGEQAVTYADALRSRRSWWRRIWWSVHPGPLRWRRD
jgi:hypothetical protein